MQCLTATDIKKHPFFANVEWDQILTRKAAFVPQIADETDTSYFDQDRLGSPLGTSFEFNDSIGHMDMTPERVPYTGSDTSSEEDEEAKWLSEEGGVSKRNSTAFLNFSFVSLPNLQQLTKDTVVKFSPRVEEPSE